MYFLGKLDALMGSNLYSDHKLELNCHGHAVDRNMPFYVAVEMKSGVLPLEKSLGKQRFSFSA